jgi:alkylhydroperoxidase family enzyme
MDITTYFAREAKIANDKIAAVREGPQAAALAPLESAVMRFADGMTETPAHTDDATFTELKEKLGDVAMVELAGAIALENFSARFNHAFDCTPAGLADRKSRSGK